jgi:hypothetical protein
MMTIHELGNLVLSSIFRDEGLEHLSPIFHGELVWFVPFKKWMTWQFNHRKRGIELAYTTTNRGDPMEYGDRWRIKPRIDMTPGRAPGLQCLDLCVFFATHNKPSWYNIEPEEGLGNSCVLVHSCFESAAEYSFVFRYSFVQAVKKVGVQMQLNSSSVQRQSERQVSCCKPPQCENCFTINFL